VEHDHERADDATIRCLAVPRGDVVFGDGTPKGVSRVGGVYPAFDAHEKPFDSGPVALNHVLLGVDGALREVPRPFSFVVHESGHKIFGAGENEVSDS
jgi:hypothetical protein